MLHNDVRRRLAEGGEVFGCFLRYAEPLLAEFVALQGWDFLVFDGEHGTLEPRDVEGLTRAAQVRGTTPFARVPTNQAHDVLRFLDTGVHGIHVPWVNTAAEAEAAVTAAKYGPRGQRGLAGGRASDWGVTEPIGDYTRRANEETMVVVHIETTEAVAAIDDYLTVDGIDVLFLGPTDLSHSLGHPGEVDHPDVVAAMEHVAAAVAPSDTVLGVFTGTPERVDRWRQQGARYFTTTPERFLRAGMVDWLDRARTA